MSKKWSREELEQFVKTANDPKVTAIWEMVVIAEKEVQKAKNLSRWKKFSESCPKTGQECHILYSREDEDDDLRIANMKFDPYSDFISDDNNIIHYWKPLGAIPVITRELEDEY